MKIQSKPLHHRSLKPIKIPIKKSIQKSSDSEENFQKLFNTNQSIIQDMNPKDNQHLQKIISFQNSQLELFKSSLKESRQDKARLVEDKMRLVEEKNMQKLMYQKLSQMSLQNAQLKNDKELLNKENKSLKVQIKQLKRRCDDLQVKQQQKAKQFRSSEVLSLKKKQKQMNRFIDNQEQVSITSHEQEQQIVSKNSETLQKGGQVKEEEEKV